MNDSADHIRSRLMSIAYRMLGSVADAEDAVQDAFLRCQLAGEVTSREGFLVRTTTRLCIDRLRERKRRNYVGPWVPEPVASRIPRLDEGMSESLTQAFLLMLERLTPDERAAFLLRVVFDYEYSELAATLGKSEDSSRQLVSRARKQLGLETARRFTAAPATADELAERFIAACQLGDIVAVESMLSEDAEAHSDGGGKVSAALAVIHGRDRVARYIIGAFHKRWLQDAQFSTVNGDPGYVFLNEGKVDAVMSIRITDKVQGVYITRNPDKLERWATIDIE